MSPDRYTWNFPLWFFLVWNYQVYSIKVVISLQYTTIMVSAILIDDLFDILEEFKNILMVLIYPLMTNFFTVVIFTLIVDMARQVKHTRPTFPFPINCLLVPGKKPKLC